MYHRFVIKDPFPTSKGMIAFAYDFFFKLGRDDLALESLIIWFDNNLEIPEKDLSGGFFWFKDDLVFWQKCQKLKNWLEENLGVRCFHICSSNPGTTMYNDFQQVYCKFNKKVKWEKR